MNRFKVPPCITFASSSCPPFSQLKGAPGFYGPDGTSPTACSAGSYTSSAGQSSCTVCGDDQYTASTASTGCQACPSNTGVTGSTAASHDQIGDCIAKPGYYGTAGSAATACAVGTYTQTSGQTACTVCGNNTYASATGTSSCSACPPNTMTTGTAASSRDQITDCVAKPGFYGAAGAAATGCPAGAYSATVGATSCTTVCGNNTYSNGAATACTNCPSNTMTLGTTIDFHNSSLDCVAKPGYYGAPGSAATACPAGFFSNTTNSPQCALCSANKYSLGAATQCISCPTNTITNPTNSSTFRDELSDCVAIAGYYGSGNSVAPCPAGTFSSQSGKTSCDLCSNNTYSLGTATSCTPCPPNTVTLGTDASLHDEFSDCVAKAGFFSMDGGPPMPCQPGTYKSYDGSAPATAYLYEDQWPPGIDRSKVVHFVSVDNFLTVPQGSSTWLNNLIMLNGGDQTTTKVNVSSNGTTVIRTAVKSTSNYFNTADPAYSAWASEPEVDILMQLLSDKTVVNRTFQFLIGTLGNGDQTFVTGGYLASSNTSVSTATSSSMFRWYRFRITNGLRSTDGARYIGSLANNTAGANTYGGINSGTIRLENSLNLTIRAVAFGQKNAFGDLTDCIACGSSSSSSSSSSSGNSNSSAGYNNLYSNAPASASCLTCPTNTGIVNAQSQGPVASDTDDLEDCVPLPGYYGPVAQIPTPCPPGYYKDSIGVQAASILDQWPASINVSKVAHFVSLGNFLSIPTYANGSNSRWLNNLFFATTTDLAAPKVTGGRHALQTGSILNLGDPTYSIWANESSFDVLLQVFGSASIVGNITCQIGTLPNNVSYTLSNMLPGNGPVPPTAANGQWNWVLLRLPNPMRPDGRRYMGTLAVGSTGTNQYGGINGGTLRFTVQNNTLVRAAAIGQDGAFGDSQQFLDFSVSGPRSCTMCTGHTYASTTGSSQCAPCPSNTIITGSATDAASRDAITDCLPNVGYYGAAGAAALPCPAGSYGAAVGATNCTVCGPNTYSNATAATSGATCLSCPANTVASSVNASGHDNITDCLPTAGYYGVAGQPAQPCPMGSYSSSVGAVQCSVCLANTYSVATAATSFAVCVTCPANTVTVNNTLATSHDAINDCFPNAGYYGPPGSVPLPCPAGSYSASVGSTACTTCSGNMYSSTLAASSATTCVACPNNTVLASSTLPADHDSVSDCLPSAGYFGPAGVAATPCPAGSYSTAAGSSACTTCDKDRYSTAIAAATSATCVACPSNTITTSSSTATAHDAVTDCVAKAGFFGPNGGPVTACPAGTYNDQVGATDIATSCVVCGPNTFSITVGANASSACQLCPTNTITTGTTAANHDEVTDCLAAPGYFGTAGSPALPCAPGTYGISSPGLSLCSVCPDGTFSTTTAASSADVCTSCPTNTVTLTGLPGVLASNHDELTDCLPRAGYYGNNGSAAVPCPAATYKSVVGGVFGNASDCSPCTYSTSVYSTLASTACSTCPANTETQNSVLESFHDSIKDCKSKPGDYGSGLSCARPSDSSGPSPMVGGLYSRGTAYVTRLSSVFCDSVESYLDGWTSPFESECFFFLKAGIRKKKEEEEMQAICYG